MNIEEKIKKLEEKISMQKIKQRELVANISPEVFCAMEDRRRVLRELNKNIRKLGRLDKNALITFEAWPKENNNNNIN